MVWPFSPSSSSSPPTSAPSSTSSSGPKSPDGGFVAPDRSARERCYESRDRLFGCLDRNDILDAVGEDEKSRKVCRGENEAYERDCAKAWVGGTLLPFSVVSRGLEAGKGGLKGWSAVWHRRGGGFDGARSLQRLRLDPDDIKGGEVLLPTRIGREIMAPFPGSRACANLMRPPADQILQRETSDGIQPRSDHSQDPGR